MCEQKEEGISMDFFESIYHGEPPWDIGRPQKEYMQLEQEGEIVGSVLDVGCGTGENTLYLAEHGHEVWGSILPLLQSRKHRRKPHSVI